MVRPRWHDVVVVVAILGVLVVGMWVFRHDVLGFFGITGGSAATGPAPVIPGNV